VIDDAVGFVDVVDGAIAKAAHGRIIFFPGDVIVSFIQKFHRAVKAAGPVHMGVDRRMIVQILAVVNRGALDFVDGFVDLANGMLFFFVHVMSGRKVFEMSASVAQVRERMQVSRMPSGFVGESGCSTKSDQKRDCGAMSYGFHVFLEAFRQDELRWYKPGTEGLDSPNSTGCGKPAEVTAVQQQEADAVTTSRY
jgi:hypothetical protein